MEIKWLIFYVIKSYKSGSNLKYQKQYFTHEEKAALITSIESSHHRISIMAFYIDRKVKRKTQGGNTWGK